MSCVFCATIFLGKFTTENKHDWGGYDESSRTCSRSSTTRRQRVQATSPLTLRSRRLLFTPSQARLRRQHPRAPAARRRGRRPPPSTSSSASNAPPNLLRNEFIDAEARYDAVRCRCRQLQTAAKLVSARAWDSHATTERLWRLRALMLLVHYHSEHVACKKYRSSSLQRFLWRSHRLTNKNMYCV